MYPILFELFSGAVAVVFAMAAYRAIRSGRARFGPFSGERDRRPYSYWFLVLMFAYGVIFSGGLAVLKILGRLPG